MGPPSSRVRPLGAAEGAREPWACSDSARGGSESSSAPCPPQERQKAAPALYTLAGFPEQSPSVFSDLDV